MISVQTQIAVPCSWCLQEQGKPQGSGSHGICRAHATAEYERYRAARPQVAPVYAICGHIGRSEQCSCGAFRCTQNYGC